MNETWKISKVKSLKKAKKPEIKLNIAVDNPKRFKKIVEWNNSDQDDTTLYVSGMFSFLTFMLVAGVGFESAVISIIIILGLLLGAVKYVNRKVYWVEE